MPTLCDMPIWFSVHAHFVKTNIGDSHCVNKSLVHPHFMNRGWVSQCSLVSGRKSWHHVYWDESIGCRVDLFYVHRVRRWKSCWRNSGGNRHSHRWLNTTYWTLNITKTKAAPWPNQAFFVDSIDGASQSSFSHPKKWTRQTNTRTAQESGHWRISFHLGVCICIWLRRLKNLTPRNEHSNVYKKGTLTPCFSLILALYKKGTLTSSCLI